MGDLCYAQKIQIQRLQDNLSALRRIAGWTMDELGKRIGVTKQTISNLENSNKKTFMTMTQYLAIRSVLDYEAAIRLEKNQTDTLLALAIKKVLDDNLDDDEKKTVEGDVALIAAAVAGKTPDKTVKELANEKLGESKVEGNKLAIAVTAASIASNVAPGILASPLILGTGMLAWMGRLLSAEHLKTIQEEESDEK